MWPYLTFQQANFWYKASFWKKKSIFFNSYCQNASQTNQKALKNACFWSILAVRFENKIDFFNEALYQKLACWKTRYGHILQSPGSVGQKMKKLRNKLATKNQPQTRFKAMQHEIFEFELELSVFQKIS